MNSYLYLIRAPALAALFLNFSKFIDGIRIPYAIIYILMIILQYVILLYTHTGIHTVYCIYDHIPSTIM